MKNLQPQGQGTCDQAVEVFTTQRHSDIVAMQVENLQPKGQGNCINATEEFSNRQGQCSNAAEEFTTRRSRNLQQGN